MLFDEPLRQPDQRSCGAAVLVVHELLRRPAYDARAGTPLEFRREVLAMHRRVTSTIDVAGRFQLPWPRALGTPPWAVARQLEARTGLDHEVRPAWPDRGSAYERIAAAAASGRPVPVYVGSAWLPRHVVLAVEAVDGAIRFYEPAGGLAVWVSRGRFVGETLGLAGWDRPWFTVAPVSGHPARRTPA